MQIDEEFLEHYGILGMRWGVRRTPEQLKRATLRRKEKGKPVTPTKKSKKLTSTPKNMVSKDAKDAETAKAKIRTKKNKPPDLSALSNQELQDLLIRTHLEERYTKVTPNQKTAASKAAGVGQDYAVRILKGVGDQAAKEVSKVAFNEILKVAVNR